MVQWGKPQGAGLPKETDKSAAYGAWGCCGAGETELIKKGNVMAIIGIDEMDVNQLNAELSRGARFVVFQYCISICILTFKRSSDVYFFKAGESHIGTALPFIIMSLILGWWGIPWGPIYTVQTMYTDLRGGKDVTQEVINALNAPDHITMNPTDTINQLQRQEKSAMSIGC